jgi:glycerophosphoryl diester phosphodiesterase
MERRKQRAAREVARLAGTDFRRAWRQLLVTDLAYKLIAAAILTPLVGLAARGAIALSGRTVLADQEILEFVLHPAGLIATLVVAALALTLVAAEQASLMAVAAGAAEDVHVAAVEALLWTARRTASVLALALRLVGRGLLLAAPFLAGLALVYLTLLREHDINYYLKARPPAFLVAAAFVAILLVGLVAVLVPRLLAWSLALPLVLFEDVAPRRALAESARRTAAGRRTVGVALVLWGLAATLLSLGVSWLFFALGRALVPQTIGNVGLVLPLMLLLVVVWALASLLVGWLQAAAFALLLVRLFEQVGGGRPRITDRLAEVRRLGGATGTGLSWRGTLVALGVLALVVAGAGLILLAGLRGNDDVVVIAHRGAAAYAPENTLAAVDRAIAQGTDFVEIDVQETADGELVVVHDSDFMKVAGVGVRVWDATWPELEQIDVGRWFGPEFAGERVPRLADVLERARGKAKVTIELKYYGHDEDLERRAVDLVDALGVADGVIFMSLEHEAVRKVKALRPGWTAGLLTAKAVGDLTELDADFLAVHTGILSRSFVRRAHAEGKQVYAWTVNDPVRMFQVMNLGVDGIITDRPDLARSVLERRAALSSFERLLVGFAFFFGAAAPDPSPTVDGA